MKTKISVMLILAAMLTGGLTSCGQTGDNNSNGGTTTKAAVENKTEDDTPTAEEVTETVSETESQPDEEAVSSEAESQPDESEAEDDTNDETEPAVSVHDQRISEMEDYRFENGSTFSELCGKGMANVYEEGKGYAIVPLEGGAAAGSVYYSLLNSTDGGKNWVPCQNYQEMSGMNTYFALDDGGLMRFSKPNAMDLKFPMVSYLCFDGISIKSADLVFDFSSLEIEGGLSLEEASEMDYDLSIEVDYIGGYKFNITVTDEYTYETVFDDDIDLTDAVTNALADMY